LGASRSILAFSRDSVVPLKDMAIYEFKGLSWANSANRGTVC
jgi:hypothetical protein